MEQLGARREPVGPTVAAPAAVPGGKGRWSARRKMTVVLELLRGAELEATSLKYGVTAGTLPLWREAFVEGGEAGLKIRATDVVDEERKTLKSDVVKERLDPVNGFVRVPERPGLGVTLDRPELERLEKLRLPEEDKWIIKTRFANGA